MPFRTLDSLDAQGKRVLLRADLNVPVRDGKLALGEFQRIALTEFEGPRRRQIELRLLAEA